MLVPAELRYTSEHEWLRAEANSLRLGVTDFAQRALGEVVFVDVPRIGMTISPGEAFSWIESAKVVTDLVLPVGGTVIESNALLVGQPQLVNQDPYGAGWICLIEPQDWHAFEGLLNAEGYRQMIGEQP